MRDVWKSLSKIQITIEDIWSKILIKLILNEYGSDLLSYKLTQLKK